MVIVYDGRNDMFFGSMPSYRPNWVPRDEDMMAFLQRPAWMEDPLQKYFFVNYLFHTRILHPPVSVYPSGAYSTRDGVRFAYAPHREAVDVYHENLRNLVALLRDRRVGVALIYQPTLLSKAVRSPREDAIVSKLAPRYVEAMRTMLPLGARAMADVAGREHVLAADFTTIFDHEPGTMYIDDVHQTDRGNRVIAARIYALIQPMLTSAENDRESGK